MAPKEQLDKPDDLDQRLKDTGRIASIGAGLTGVTAVVAGAAAVVLTGGAAAVAGLIGAAAAGASAVLGGAAWVSGDIRDNLNKSPDAASPGGAGDAGGASDIGDIGDAGGAGGASDIGDIGDAGGASDIGDAGGAGDAGDISGAGDIGGAGGGCFVADTLVALTESTSKPIQMIQIGDFILSRNEVTRKLAEQKVLHIWTHNVKEILILKLSNGEKIETTKEHRFSIENKGFVSAGGLNLGTKLDNYTEEDIQIVDIEIKFQETTVYNLEVDKFHTYFVGDTGAWVHNVKIVEEELGVVPPPQ